MLNGLLGKLYKLKRYNINIECCVFWFVGNFVLNFVNYLVLKLFVFIVWLNFKKVILLLEVISEGVFFLDLIIVNVYLLYSLLFGGSIIFKGLLSVKCFGLVFKEFV